MRVRLIAVNPPVPRYDILKSVFAMGISMKKTALQLLAGMVLAVAPMMLSAAESHVDCNLRFTAGQWSPQQAAVTGAGMLTCTNGSAMPVMVGASGPGIAAGRWSITDGRGAFGRVARIEDILGSYAAIEGDIGVSAAGTVQALTKGKLSLRLSGKGQGFSAGIAIRDFSISRLADSPRRPAAQAQD
jgi:hypothetical protein